MGSAQNNSTVTRVAREQNQTTHGFAVCKTGSRSIHHCAHDSLYETTPEEFRKISGRLENDCENTFADERCERPGAYPVHTAGGPSPVPECFLEDLSVKTKQ